MCSECPYYKLVCHNCGAIMYRFNELYYYKASIYNWFNLMVHTGHIDDTVEYLDYKFGLYNELP